jgi:hypothetical protein
VLNFLSLFPSDSSRLFSLSQKHITHRVSCWSRREAAQAAHMLLAAQAVAREAESLASVGRRIDG